MQTRKLVLVVCPEQDAPRLLETISDEQEIKILNYECRKTNAPLALERVRTYRQSQQNKEEQMGNALEELLANPFLKTDVQTQAIRWFKSKIAIDNLHKMEHAARQVILEYALKLFSSNPKCTNFTLKGNKAQIQIEIVPMDTRLEKAS